MLANLNQKPSHGYELIKSIGQLTSGLYTPSPGVIYPTLTLLEDQQLIVAENTGNGRKSYSLTPEGNASGREHRCSGTDCTAPAGDQIFPPWFSVIR
ncbi:PadR family transcriptional regulator [Morganella morganii]|uniref:PadR family transcriptional regulator n=1 Tax=Morganella morganii TaxID=582 RepID=UPI003EBE4BA2